MADITDIVASEEMGDVVKALAALRKRFQPHGYGNDYWPIATGLVGRYKAPEVLRILLNNDPYYPGYKEVLAASFAGWLVAPKYPKLRRDLMIRAALDHMRGAEAAAGIVSDTGLTLEKDIAARYVFTGVDFLVEVYDCLGGYSAFSEVPSLDELWTQLAGVEKVINTAARAVAFLHHAVNQHKGTAAPSLNKTIAVFDALKAVENFPYKERYVSRSLLHERWSQNKQTLALMYAASTIQVNRTTLLDELLAGLFSYRVHQKYFDLWVSRARFVATHIFNRMADPSLRQATMLIIGEGTEKAFSPSRLLGHELVSFREIFPMKNK